MASLTAPAQISAGVDAEALRKACEGWGTDEKTLISIIGHRNAAQRKQIRQAYQDRYEEDLIHRLEKEINGDFERAVYRWILDPSDREAVLLNVAMKNGGASYNVIAELSCVLCPEELLALRRAYQNRYKHSLEEDVAAHTTGDIRMLLVALATAYRYNGDEINTKLAKSEAEILHNAIKDKAFNHEEVVRILSTRSKLQLTATFNHYKDAYGTSITKSLSTDKANEYVVALDTAIRSIRDPKKYFERVLRNALNETGTNEDALTRVIVTRAEKDLREIMELYFKRSSIALEHAVAKETSGHYKGFLLALLGKED